MSLSDIYGETMTVTVYSKANVHPSTHLLNVDLLDNGLRRWLTKNYPEWTKADCHTEGFKLSTTVFRDYNSTNLLTNIRKEI